MTETFKRNRKRAVYLEPTYRALTSALSPELELIANLAFYVFSSTAVGRLFILFVFRFHSRLLGMQSAQPSALELKPTTYKSFCKKLHYLVDRQQELCGLNQNILQMISRGAKIGIDECQHQFHMNRWNCTTYHNSSNVFGDVVSVRKFKSYKNNANNTLIFT